MKLVVNGIAVTNTSLGGRRYFDGIVRRLDWRGGIELWGEGRRGARARVAELCHTSRSDVIFWTPSQRGPLRARNHVVTVLDCINVEHTYRDDWRLPLYRRLFEQVLRGARAVVAISNATRDAILRHYDIGSREVTVIAGPSRFPGTHGPFAATTPPFRAAESRPFVLMFANLLPHKNVMRAIEAFAQSSAANRGIALRTVGRLPEGAKEVCARAGVMLEPHRAVDDDSLDAWLRGCEFLLSPSLDEGLNLPIGEALSAGARVLCSDIAVHREFYNGHVRWFEPWCTEAIVAALDEAFEAHDVWVPPGAAVAGITFDEVARRYHALFTDIVTPD